MTGAWWCHDEAQERDVDLEQTDLMQEIVRYNQVDCKVMMEIIHYLRQHH